MSTYVVEQRRVAHRGRDFHFVSYEAPVDKATKSQGPPMWYLMSAGKRWQVMEQMRGQPAAELDGLFVAWLDRHVFALTG
jgi:hypothetical protein